MKSNKPIEQLFYNINQHLVNYQGKMVNRLRHLDIESIAAEIMNIKEMFEAVKVVSMQEQILDSNPAESFTGDAWLKEMFVSDTANAQQILTIINSAWPENISGHSGLIKDFVQSVSTLCAKLADMDTVLRFINFTNQSLDITLALPLSQMQADFLQQGFHGDVQDLVSCHYHLLIKSRALLEVLGGQCDIQYDEHGWLHISCKIPLSIENKQTEFLDSSLVILFCSESNADWDRLFGLYCQFPIKIVDCIDALSYYLSQPDCQYHVLLESNEELVEFSQLFEQELVSLPIIYQHMQVSYIGDNYLQAPLPPAMILWSARIVAPVNVSQLNEKIEMTLLDANCTLNLRILIIEDQPASAELFEYVCQRVGDAVTVNSAEEALVVLAKDINFDLLLVDIGLANMDGIAFMAARPDRAKAIPVMAISGHVLKKPDLVKHGFIDFLPKPFSWKQLLVKIHHICPQR